VPVGRRLQPAASACEVHHTRHKADGGKTSTRDCVLLCTYHHQIAIHRQGWTLVLNPDGTTTAWNKDKTKVLHSHGPRPGPGRARHAGGYRLDHNQQVDGEQTDGPFGPDNGQPGVELEPG
jgi:hypothetical protein